MAARRFRKTHLAREAEAEALLERIRSASNNSIRPFDVGKALTAAKASDSISSYTYGPSGFVAVAKTVAQIRREMWPPMMKSREQRELELRHRTRPPLPKQRHRRTTRRARSVRRTRTSSAKAAASSGAGDGDGSSGSDGDGSSDGRLGRPYLTLVRASVVQPCPSPRSGPTICRARFAPPPPPGVGRFHLPCAGSFDRPRCRGPPAL